VYSSNTALKLLDIKAIKNTTQTNVSGYKQEWDRMMAQNSSELKSTFREKLTSINNNDHDEEDLPNEDQLIAAGIIGSKK